MIGFFAKPLFKDPGYWSFEIFKDLPDLSNSLHRKAEQNLLFNPMQARGRATSENRKNRKKAILMAGNYCRNQPARKRAFK
jgi:hypothetical protein